MATVIGRGGAAAVSQVTDYLFAGTWEASDIVDFTIGPVTISGSSGGSATITTAIDALVVIWNAFSATLYPQFAELTASRSGNNFRLTADTAGKPFIVTLSTRDAGGAADAQTIDGATSSTGTNTVANSGPNDWGTAANWSTGAVPVNGDDVIFENSNWNVRYGLDQNGVDLASLTFKRSYIGQIGLPDLNVDGGAELGAGAYPEYRQKDLKIGRTLLTIGEGEGEGSSFLNLDGDSTASTIIVYHTGSGQGRAALRVLGSSTSNVYHISGGQVDIAGNAGDTAPGIATLNVMGDDTTRVRVGAGANPLTVVNVRGGFVELNSNAVTLTQTGGEVHLMGTMTLTTGTIDGGTLYDRTSGTVTTYNCSDGGTIDFTRDPRAKTVTNFNIYSKSIPKDPNKRVTATNNFVLVRCSLADVPDMDLGTNITLARS